MTDLLLIEQFTTAYTFLNDHPEINLSNETKLKASNLYGHYKVVTVGKNDTAKPSLWDLRGRAKWDAWKEVENTPAEVAMQIYIETLEQANIGWNRHRLDDDDYTDYEDVDNDKSNLSTEQERMTYVSTMCYEMEEEDHNKEDDIFSYTKKGDIAELSKILDSDKVDINAKDDQGLALLHWASDQGQLEAVKLLIERGADVNILSDVEKETPLHHACISENLDCARYLYHHGANSLIKDAEESIAFDYCNIQFKEEVIKE
ncbi:15644_t:CDS:2 [Funneliformis caledonium]|uniref:15644_t:CDS:1 n=1 Tax=Funneliformis caledonium TaxID=1117310 RepID=A0A9N9A982_9GLOM|nr:15644_t:CDS:2 [Funneliformis caledonium]